MSDLVKTYKNGVEKIWSRKQWEDLGSDKYGWEPVPETPKELSNTLPAQPQQSAPDVRPAQRVRKSKDA